MMSTSWTIDHFICEEYKTSRSGLGIYRILFAANVLIYLPQHLWVPSFPDSFFNPPIGLTMFFTGFPGAPFFQIVNALAIIAAVCLLFGYMTRVASISFALLLLSCDYWAYSFGKINHDIPLIFIPLIMQAAGWGSDYSMDARHRPINETVEGSGWPFALVALMIGMAMMSAALPKALSGWLDPHSHAVRAHMLYNVFVAGRPNWVAVHMLRIKSGFFWEIFDYMTVLIEAAFLLTVFRRRAFLFVCGLACLFHLGIALAMGIAFVGNILAYSCIVDWSGIEPRLGTLLSVWNRVLESLSPIRILGSAGLLAFVYVRLGNPLQLPQEWDPIGTLICLFAGLIATLFLVASVRRWFQKPMSSPILAGATEEAV